MPTATPTTHRPESAQDRAIRFTRDELRVARYYEDAGAEAAMLGHLAALGVDEAGDELVAAAGGAP